MLASEASIEIGKKLDNNCTNDKNLLEVLETDTTCQNGMEMNISLLDTVF